MSAVAVKSEMRPAIRVMVVDDSAVIRAFITRALVVDPDIVVPVTAANGRMAIDSLARNPVDLVVLDIEMPIMDGISALPKLLEARPGLKIVVASTLTARNADISMQALNAGASDYILKPGRESIQSAADFNRDLVAKVKSLVPVPLHVAESPRTPVRAAAPAPQQEAKTQVALLPKRGVSTLPPDLIAIGSSTGGPQALFKFLGELKGKVRQPIIITQHMPATFTALFAEHIRRTTGWPAHEAKDGDVLETGRVYVAPGDFHMRVKQREDGRKVLALDQSPPVNFCRPAVDPMLRSASEVYGAKVLAVILTGMGQDGLDGARFVVEHGGTVMAQDEASSVVWGMPGAVAKAGLCSAILPLNEMGGAVVRVSNGAGL